MFALHVDRPTVVWTADVLPSEAGPAETRAFFRRYGLTHVAVLGKPGAMPGQLAYVGGREIGSVTVHNVASRTLNHSSSARDDDRLRAAGELTASAARRKSTHPRTPR